MADTEYARAERIRRARAIQNQANDELRAALLRDAPGARRRRQWETNLRGDFQGTSDEGTTQTLAGLGYGGHKVHPDFRSDVESAKADCETALGLSIDGKHSKARRYIRSARDRIASLLSK